MVLIICDSQLLASLQSIAVWRESLKIHLKSLKPLKMLYIF